MSRRNRNIFSKKRTGQRVREAIIIALLIIAIIVVLAFLYFNLFGTASKVQLKENLTAEIGSTAHVSDYIENISGGELVDDIAVDTSKLGKTKCEIGLDIGGKARLYDFEVEIVDTTAPVIEAPDSLTVLMSSGFDVSSKVKATDNSGSEPKIEYKGDYDVNKAGTYTITVDARDNSGNTSQKEIAVKVIDVSKEQGDIEFLTGKGFTGTRKDGITTIDGIMIANKTFGIPENYYPGGIMNDAWAAWNEMAEAASRDGLGLFIVSGFRSYSLQSSLYNNYVYQNGQEAADTFSARPGYSEHQTGYAMDLNLVDASFGETAEGKWLMANSYKYGYILRYPEGKQEITGYIPEAWHFRFVGKDLAKTLYNEGKWITLEEYFGIPSKYAE